MANSKIHTVYIELHRCGKKEYPSLFVGPFEGEGDVAENLAKQAIDDAIAQGREVVLAEDAENLSNPDSMICASVMPKIKARTMGLRAPEMGDARSTLYKDFPTLEDFTKMEQIPVERKGRPRKEKQEETENEQTVERTVEQSTTASKRTSAAKTEKTKKPIEKMEKGEKTMKYSRERAQEEDIADALAIKEVIVITDRMGIVAWLARSKGIDKAKVMPYITNDMVHDKVIIGVIPNHVQLGAYLIGNISVPGLPRGMKVADLSVEQLDQYGARIDFYWPARFAGSI